MAWSDSLQRHLLLATRLPLAGCWSQAGAMSQNHCLGFFWAAVPRDHWPTDSDELAEIKRVSKPPNGDCRQDIVLIGSGLDREALTEMLDEAMLTNDEFAMDRDEWKARFQDPFPEWDVRIEDLAQQ